MMSKVQFCEFPNFVFHISMFLLRKVYVGELNCFAVLKGIKGLQALLAGWSFSLLFPSPSPASPTSLTPMPTQRPLGQLYPFLIWLSPGKWVKAWVEPGFIFSLLKIKSNWKISLQEKVTSKARAQVLQISWALICCLDNTPLGPLKWNFPKGPSGRGLLSCFPFRNVNESKRHCCKKGKTLFRWIVGQPGKVAFSKNLKCAPLRQSRGHFLYRKLLPRFLIRSIVCK